MIPRVDLCKTGTGYWGLALSHVFLQTPNFKTFEKYILILVVASEANAGF